MRQLNEKLKRIEEESEINTLYLGKSNSNMDENNNTNFNRTNMDDFYFSCHERMVNDKHEGTRFVFILCFHAELLLILTCFYSDIFTESFLQKIDPRETQSMPNLSKTTLNDEIEYDLDNYKLNESSKAETDYEMVEGK